MALSSSPVNFNSAVQRLRDADKKKKKPVSPVEAAKAPLPVQFFGKMLVLECVEKVHFTLQCEDENQELISYEMTEEEVRTLLTRWKFPEIPRIISAAKYSHKIQIVPHLDRRYPPQVISLYPAAGVPDLDWQEDEGGVIDHLPEHEGLPPR